MLIMISGPYTALERSDRLENLRRLHSAARAVAAKGHVPIVGIDVALPALGLETGDASTDSVMRICLELASRCDAILVTGDSPGATRERRVFESRQLPVYRTVAEVPSA